jgi:hypothetical protein
MKRKKNHPEISKLRSDALWNKLTPEQRKTLEHWLFEENLSYTETHERAQKELGLVCARSTIRRIYKQRSKLRGAADVADAQVGALDLESAGADVPTLRAGNLKLILTRFQEKVVEEAEVKEVAAFGRLMLQSEEREIQRERVALARERFEFKAAQAALKALPLADEMKAEDEERELERIELIKQRLFGSELEHMH